MVWADQGCRGRELLGWARGALDITVQIAVRRDGGFRHAWAKTGMPPPAVPRFAVGPRRWAIERTFAWLGKYHRLSKDYECLTATSENLIYPAMSMILLRRLTGRPP